jgi:hypothetical protein
MPSFKQNGNKPQDFWLVDDSKDFGVLSGGTLEEYPQDLPIRLHVGNAAYGMTHIQGRHAAWYQHIKINPVNLLWDKLQTQGDIYTTEKYGKFKWSFRFHPGSLLVVEYRTKDNEDYLSVVTLYQHPASLDGMRVGRYKPQS